MTAKSSAAAGRAAAELSANAASVVYKLFMLALSRLCLFIYNRGQLDIRTREFSLLCRGRIDPKFIGVRKKNSRSLFGHKGKKLNC